MTDETRLKILNKTGSIFALEPFTEEKLEAVLNPSENNSNLFDANLACLNDFIPSALTKAMREANWGFLMHPLEFTEDSGPLMGYAHSYTIPATVLKVVADVYNGKNRVIGSRWLSDGRPKVFVIYKEIPEEEEALIPEDFWALVAYQVAFLAFGRFPDNVKYQHLINAYNSLLVGLLRTDSNMFNGFWEG